ncbi:MAG: HAD-IA family hydrolase [Flavisolibacter sp.]
MTSIQTIIFDLGNVLIDWNPSYLFDRIFENEPQKKAYFFEHICTEHWHSKQDAGRPIEQATNELVKIHPQWEDPIRAFYSRWKEMFHGPIQGSVEILKELKEKQYPLFALTNWSAELLQRSWEDFPFLKWFQGMVVSGEEKINKPAKEIYFILLRKYQIDPKKALFIDDKKNNVVAAKQIGLEAIQFHSPIQLREEFKKYGVLS